MVPPRNIDESPEATLTAYRALMVEIKRRSDSLSRVLDCCFADHFLPFAAIDFGYLQIRLICEAIIMACLLAHNEVPAARTAAVRREHNFDKLVRILEGIDENFFPSPIRIKMRRGSPFGIEARAGGPFLTKPELVSLYGKCGDHLHRGSIKRAFLTPRRPRGTDDVVGPVNKIIQLLSGHRILLKSPPRNELWVTMRTKLASGDVVEDVKVWRMHPTPQPPKP